MYFYLDKDDGYSKGPYQLDDLLRLPLAPDTYIFNRTNRKWQKWAGLQRQISAHSVALVRPAPRPAKTPVAEPGWQSRPEPAPSTYPEPKPARQKKAQAPSFPEMPKPRPQVLPMPGKPAPPAMGLSGVGCFVVALLFALLLGMLLFFS